MNWKSISLSIAVMCAVSQTPALAASGRLYHGKAAMVNGAVITGAAFFDELRRVERLRGVNKKSGDPAEYARNRKQAMENLISRELLFQEAVKRGVKAPEKAVAEEMGRLRKQFSTEDEFRSELGKMGLSEAAVRSQVERGMAVQQFIDAEFGKKVIVSEDDIASYYESHRDDLKEPLAESGEKIRRIIRREEAARRLTPYLKRLRESARVELLLEEE
jgi:hypothetical protein